MSSVLKAIEKDRQILLELLPHIEESVWATESGCPGWSVQDLVSHMACSYWLAVDPSRLPDPAGLPAERAADLYVESRRSMTPDEVVADYESVSRKGLELLAGLDGQDEVEIPLGDVGTYPASFVPNAFAFEAYIHLRFDLFGPNGPLAAEPPTTDELRLAPTLDWIEASLPQQNNALLGQLNDAVEVHLNGLCARILRIGDSDVAANVISDSRAFVRWITQRGTWEELGVDAEGDAASLGIVRQLRVF
jgi:uncharacterized protein (TIGR03083 family)